jgi:DNA processing protein
MVRYAGGDEESSVTALAVGLYRPGPREELSKLLLSGMSPQALRAHIGSEKVREARSIYDRCMAEGLSVVPLCSQQYPTRLRYIPAPPVALFVRCIEGVSLALEGSVAVVGTRAASVDVCAVATEISLSLCGAGFSVVSGLALGIDGAAHRGALCAVTYDRSAAVPTVAVLAHGLDRVYPPSHMPLADEIIEQGGALISEYPPGTEPLKHHFLERNRIIAGISQGVVVIQAGERSGSLVTARFGADFGRDVFVYDSGAQDMRHAGGDRMLEDGAIPCTGATEILREYGIDAEECLERVNGEVVSVEAYLSQYRISMAELLRLELAGLVVRLPGNRVKPLSSGAKRSGPC